MSKSEDIINYLNKLYPNAKTDLNYNTDYELLIATALSAQTTDIAVNRVTSVLFDKYPTLIELSKADLDDLKTIIRPVGTFNKKSVYVKEIATRLVNDHDGVVPRDRKYLESLPGVGRKTVNVFLSVFYNEPLIAVDTHVRRVSVHLGIAKDTDSVLQVEKKLVKFFPKEVLSTIHHQMIYYGREICTARNPKCDDYLLSKYSKICKKKKT